MSEHDQPVLILTNDDGVDAPGLSALFQAVRGLGRCRVIAPNKPISGCGHQVTTDRPIRITSRSTDVLRVDGTPVDCVRLALTSLATDVHWVLSGINAGGNLGNDVYTSGTVAAAREAAIQGVPAVALSQYIARGKTIDWPRAAVWAGRVLQTLLGLPWEPGTFWNVNFPHPAPNSVEPAVVFCPLDPSPLPLRYRIDGDMAVYTGVYQERVRRKGADVAVCFGGKIAVSLVRAADPPGAPPPVDGAGSGREAETPASEIWPIPPRT